MQRGTVLVINQDHPLRNSIQGLLEADGYQVLTAAPNDAVNTARASRPDIILIDVSMPGPASVLLSHSLRDDPATGLIPMVCVADGLARVIRDGMIADEWLAKPFQAERLYQAVARWAAQTRVPVSQ